MSFCRWSSDNFKCDVYAYEHVDGYFALHVASSKHVGDVPLLPDITKVSNDEWSKAHKIREDWLDTHEVESIGLSCDGDDYELDTIEDLLDKMLELRKIGYHVPDYTIENIREEIHES